MAVTHYYVHIGEIQRYDIKIIYIIIIINILKNISQSNNKMIKERKRAILNKLFYIRSFDHPL